MACGCGGRVKEEVMVRRAIPIVYIKLYRILGLFGRDDLYDLEWCSTRTVGGCPCVKYRTSDRSTAKAGGENAMLTSRKGI